MFGTAPKLCNELLRIHSEEYYDLSVVERSKMGSKYSPTNLALELIMMKSLQKYQIIKQ